MGRQVRREQKEGYFKSTHSTTAVAEISQMYLHTQCRGEGQSSGAKW